MKTIIAASISGFFLLSFFIVSPAPSEAAEASGGETSQISLSIKEWPVPWENSRPRDPDKAPDGTIWFVGQVASYIARLNPESGEMSKFDVPNSGPHMVVVDSKGIPWFAANRDGYIGRLNPETGEVKRYPMPEGAEDPHTMAWTSDEKSMWFTIQRAGRIGHLDRESGEVKTIAVPGNGMRPYGLILDKDDRPWIAFMGDNAIGTVDAERMELKLIETPDENSRIRRLDATSDGRVWWVDASEGYLGVYNPADGSMRQWRSPGGENSYPYAVAVDSKDRVWYSETGPKPNRIVGFDTKTEKFVSINEVPSGGGSVRNMIFDEEENALWFGTDTNTIGRAKIPD